MIKNIHSAIILLVYINNIMNKLISTLDEFEDKNKIDDTEDTEDIEDSLDIFIVENPGNSCYIDSLFMGLFYSQSFINQLLIKDISDVECLYLQECIKDKFMNIIDRKKSITCDDMNILKFLLMKNGWKTFDELYDQQDVSEFYTFLINKLDGDLIEIQRKTISDNEHNNSKTHIEKIPFIPLSLPTRETEKNDEEELSISVKNLLFNWMFDNTATSKSNNKDNINILHSYEIINIPTYIALSINRFQSVNKRINTHVEIQKKIRPFKHISPNNSSYEWYFHAAICHVGNNVRDGHYYALLLKDNKWFIFDDKQIPCLNEVNMDNLNVVLKIKQECVFLIYKLNM